MFQRLAIDQVLGEARRRRYGFRQELECNESLEAGVLGLVHHSHTAAAELFQDAIVGDRCADHSVPVVSEDSSHRDLAA